MNDQTDGSVRGERQGIFICKPSKNVLQKHLQRCSQGFRCVDMTLPYFKSSLKDSFGLEQLSYSSGCELTNPEYAKCPSQPWKLGTLWEHANTKQVVLLRTEPRVILFVSSIRLLGAREGCCFRTRRATSLRLWSRTLR